MHHTLDCRNMLCPMPVIKTQNKIKELTPGDTLTVVCTDPGVEHDIPAWCRVHGVEVKDLDVTAEQITLTLLVQQHG